MILALSIILIVLLAFGVVLLAAAISMRCMGFYEDFCSDIESQDKK